MGLLGTQSGYLKNDEALAAVNESKQRVQAMALIHQKLYQSDDLSAIKMPEYVHELVAYLDDSFDFRKKIRVDLEIESIALDLSYAIPIGLILNEAITNSIKYAFEGKENGRIQIVLRQVIEGQFLLVIADNGIGLQVGVDPYKRDTMGMNLMQGLSEDIGGNFKITGNDGTRISIEFRNDNGTIKHRANSTMNETAIL